MKTILITGATDGIGAQTAKRLAAEGHNLLVHGRSAAKLTALVQQLRAIRGAKSVEAFRADFASLTEVARLARQIVDRNGPLDVVINNAGVFRTDTVEAPDGRDVRMVVNTLAPALLTRIVLPVIPAQGRFVHLSSAAQAPVDLRALSGPFQLEAMSAYAQSKLALTMWSQSLADELGADGPVSVAVNPGSLLATRMVKEGFGVEGNDISIGAAILRSAALSDEFRDATGLYYDNDIARFSTPHADASDAAKVTAVTQSIESAIAQYRI